MLVVHYSRATNSFRPLNQLKVGDRPTLIGTQRRKPTIVREIAKSLYRKDVALVYSKGIEIPKLDLSEVIQKGILVVP